MFGAKFCTSALAASRPNVKKPRVVAASATTKVVSKTAGAGRPSWYPGSTNANPPYLDGTLPGDYGFDPMGFCRVNTDQALRWTRNAELIHGRLAMTAFAGMLVGEAFSGIPWYKAGGQPIGWISIGTLVVLQILLTGWVEFARGYYLANPKLEVAEQSYPGGLPRGAKDAPDPLYPGGRFDPGNFSKRPDFEKLKVAEIKHGRLAMLAVVGMISQAVATGEPPLQNLGDHLADPWNVNVANNSVAIPFLPGGKWENEVSMTVNPKAFFADPPKFDLDKQVYPNDIPQPKTWDQIVTGPKFKNQ